ncbi:unnamed protein product [Lota lota]
MPLDVRGCTRATLSGSACACPSPTGVGNPLNPARDGDWGLQLFPMNEEFPVSTGHKLVLIKSLPFVHTARRYYRLDGLVRSSDRPRRSLHGSGARAEKTIKLDYLEESLRSDGARGAGVRVEAPTQVSVAGKPGRFPSVVSKTTKAQLGLDLARSTARPRVPCQTLRPVTQAGGGFNDRGGHGASASWSGAAPVGRLSQAFVPLSADVPSRDTVEVKVVRRFAGRALFFSPPVPSANKPGRLRASRRRAGALPYPPQEPR